LLLLIALEVACSDRITREETANTAAGATAVAGSTGSATTTTMEKTSTGDATFFIPATTSGGSQQGFSFDPNSMSQNHMSVSTRSIDPSGGMYGRAAGSPFGAAGFGGAGTGFDAAAGSPFAGSPFFGGAAGGPLVLGGAGFFGPGFGGPDPTLMNPLALYQQMLYYRQMSQFLLGQRTGAKGSSTTYSAASPTYSASPFPYARYILRDKLKTTRKD
ncbi:hypothetical protein PFISCL1PPCAC_3579, partial [Pristionchus fissidentatus]